MLSRLQEEDVEAAGGLVGHAFAIKPSEGAEWLREHRKHVRVVWDAKSATIQGTLLRIPMGQFFGGRSVSTCGVAGVTVAGQSRGKGIGTKMMSESVREMRTDGFALSTLYASTPKLYRRSGWENAGVSYKTTLETRELPRSASLSTHPAEEGDEKAIRACYRAFAKTRDGFLDRGDYIWPRTRRPMDGKPVYGFLFGDRKRPEGYVVYRQLAKDPPGIELVVTDYAYLTARAMQRILGILAEHRVVCSKTYTSFPPFSPITLSLPDRQSHTEIRETWMLRVLDVTRAIEERGYPKNVSCRFTLAVKDMVARANNEKLSVTVEDGRATVRTAKSANIVIDVGTFASVYTGFSNPHALAAVGRIQASLPSLDKLAVCFSGTPTLVDFF